MIRQPDGSYAVEGRTRLREVGDALGPGFEAEVFDTGGGLLGLPNHPPEVGDEVRVGNRGLRVGSVDQLRVGRVTVQEERAGAHTRGDDRHRIFLHLDDADHDEHLAVPNKVESLLDKRPGSEVEVVGNAATSSRVKLLGLLAGRNLSVAVHGDSLKAWCTRSVFELPASPLGRDGRSNRGTRERRR